jgi:hypothetical protein
MKRNNGSTSGRTVLLIALALGVVVMLIGAFGVNGGLMRIVSGAIVIGGVAAMLLEILMGSPTHRILRAAMVLIIGFGIMGFDGLAAIGLAAALAVEAYLHRHSVAAAQNSPPPTMQQPPAQQ